MITRNKDISELLKDSFGYCILTLSNYEGYKKIALKRNKLKGDYLIIFYNDDEKIVEQREVNIFITGKDKITIEGFGEFEIRDYDYSLTNPEKVIEHDSKLYNEIVTKSEDGIRKVYENMVRRIINEKDAEIESLKSELKSRENYYTINRVDRLRDVSRNLVIGEVTCYSHDYKMEDLGRSFGGYQMTSKSSTSKKEKSNGIKFVIEQLEKTSMIYKSDAFEDNRFNVLNNKIDELFKKLENGYDENTADSIQSLYGLLAEELTIRLINLFNHIRINNIDTTQLVYSATIFRNTHRFYEDRSEYEEIETIDNYFDTLIDGACSFIERVTGNNIKNELYSRLNIENKKRGK